MVTRNDPHRPGAIIPSDYEYVLTFERSSQDAPSFGINCALDYRNRETGELGQHHGTKCCLVTLRAAGTKFADLHPGSCDVCGANFRIGDVWEHLPTHEHIVLGHICADKYSLCANRSEWETWHKGERDRRAVAIKARRRAQALDSFLQVHPGLDEILAVDHPILRDMVSQLRRYGSLSDKQIAFAHKLADEVKNPAPPEKHVSAPEGRVTVRGKIVSVKSVEGPYGTSIKMVVKVETPEGSWLVWTTAPSAILGTEIKGHEVEFTATLTRGRDEFFAFGKRPTKARLL